MEESGMMSKRRDLLQSLIEKLSLPFRAADIIPLGTQPQEKKRQREGAKDENGVEAPAVLMQNKYVRVGKKEIERGQAMVNFGVSKNHRLRCQVRFNFCGNEKQRLTEALDTLRRGVSKLSIAGWLLVSNELLVWLVTEFPLLQSIKIYLEDPLCNQVTDTGLSAMVAAAPHLRKLHLNHLRNINALSFKSAHLEGLSLTGLGSCTKVEIVCPRLSNLELKFGANQLRGGPLVGIHESVLCCAKNLRWLCLTYPFAAEELLFLDHVPHITNLGIKLPSMEALRHKVPHLTLLELYSGNLLDLNQLIDWKGLRDLRVHGEHKNLSYYLQQAPPQLRNLSIEGCNDRAIAIDSRTLETVRLSNCPNLTFLSVNCPSAEAPIVDNCPNVDR